MASSGRGGGYTDHHVHLAATVAARLSIDVSAAETVEEIGEVIRAGLGARTGWIRAWGYDESVLPGGRHPTAADLDGVAGGRPIVLHHRTGHAAVLNTPALAEIDVDRADGVLFDQHVALSRVPRLDPDAMQRAAASVSQQWEAAGVVAVVDATHTNDLADIEMLDSWCRSGCVTQTVTAMPGADSGMVEGGAGYGSRVGWVTIGPAKIMPRPGADLGATISRCHHFGYPVAVHVTEIDVLDATLRAFDASPPPVGTSDRIEHNALCLPEQVDRIAGRHVTVVVNPSFLLHRRRKYETQLTEVERSWLIRIGSLLRAGVEVRAGSDSPVVPCRPDEMMAAAADHPFAPSESISPQEAALLLAPL